MPDGSKRKRRNRGDLRARYYAAYRSARFARRFGGIVFDIYKVCDSIKAGERE